MSLYNSPKEHKLRKPRSGFEKIKKHQWDELNTPKEEIEIKPLIELSEQAKFRIKKKRQRSLLIQILVFTFVLIPLTFVAVNFFYTKVETTHKKLAPHHYKLTNFPTDDVLNIYLKRGYTAYANQEYQKAILAFKYLKENYAVTTFALTGLISSYDELCKMDDLYHCDLLYASLLKYKDFYNIENQKHETIIKEIKAYNQFQVDRFLSE